MSLVEHPTRYLHLRTLLLYDLETQLNNPQMSPPVAFVPSAQLMLLMALGGLGEDLWSGFQMGLPTYKSVGTPL